MQTVWREAYADLQKRIDQYAKRADWTLCGLSVCVDAFVKLSVCDAVLRSGPSEAQVLGAELRRRAAAGVGGEIRIDWLEGPQWVDANLPVRTALGGTAAHAARLLTLLGAPALLALGHRGAEQLSALDPDILLAVGERPVRADEITPRGDDRPRVYVFEFTAGDSFGGVTPPRSSRIIVRFHDLDLECDADFTWLGARLIAGRPGLGAGVLAGFNGLGAEAALEAGLQYGRDVAQSWKDAGIGVIHLEMAGYESACCRDKALHGLADSITSVGMSLSEFRAIDPVSPLSIGIRDLGDRMGIDRVCVHADDWAISATRRDAGQEREALMMGCLLASARAACGDLIVPKALPAEAHFEEPPAEETHGSWHIVSCPSPYLERPQTTLGLGDTFMAGCLLVLGQEKLPGTTVPVTGAETPPTGFVELQSSARHAESIP